MERVVANSSVVPGRYETEQNRNRIEFKILNKSSFELSSKR